VGKRLLGTLDYVAALAELPDRKINYEPREVSSARLELRRAPPPPRSGTGGFKG
jgi:hypothetical protein